MLALFISVCVAQCGDGALSATATISDQNYVDEDPLISIAPSYTYTKDPAVCPLDAVLYI